MAPEQGPIATGAPLAAPAAPPTTTASTATSDSLAPANELGHSRSLKRQRETTPTGADLSGDGEMSPSKLARLMTYARQSPPPPLTGAAALEDERRRKEEEQHRLEHPESSPNPTHRVLADLMSGVEAMSRPHDGPSTASSEVEAASIAVARALNAVSIPTTNPGHSEAQEVSPQSAPSAVSRETLSEGPGEVVHSPAAMDIDSRSDQRLYTQQPDAQMEDKTAGSLSYPGPMQPGNPMAPPRGMSLPMTNSQNQELSPRSPTSGKKHKCQYCSTEFTRHHNLKSHLLTHSQEKPFVCQTCSMRFRRLHDLKRHGKLHTGEKPHICPKCDRKFARGDALARHSKGSGGCAGRRPSMGGSFAEDDYDTSGMGGDDSAMAGVLYDNPGGVDMSEEDRRRLSLPSIKGQQAPGQPGAEAYVVHSSTYPPAGPRPSPASGLYPPNIERPSTGSTTSPSLPNSHTPHTSMSSVPVSATSTSMYSQNGMTESPKPLNPDTVQANQPGHDATLARQRSPRQQTHLRQPDQASSGLSLPSHGMSPAAKQAWLSQYPPADRDAPQANTALPTTTSPSHQAATRGRGRASSGANAGHASNASNGVTVDNAQILINNDNQIWAYIQQMEAKLKQVVDELEGVKKDNMHLRDKLAEHEHHFAALNNEVAAMRRPSTPTQPQSQPAQAPQPGPSPLQAPPLHSALVAEQQQHQQLAQHLQQHQQQHLDHEAGQTHPPAHNTATQIAAPAAQP